MRRTVTIWFCLGLWIGFLSAAEVDLFPLPQQVTFTDKKVDIGTGTWKIVLAQSPEFMCTKAAERIQAVFKEHGLQEPNIEQGTNPSSNAIFIGTVSKHPNKGLVQTLGFDANASDIESQGYVLGASAEDGLIALMGKDAQGALYGATTLEQLCKGQGTGAYLLVAKIKDWPHIKQRDWGQLWYFNPWEHTEWRTQMFKVDFDRYINSYLVPHRINVISMRFGGFFFESEDNSAETRKRLRWASDEARKYGIRIEYFDWMHAPGVGLCYSCDGTNRARASNLGAFLAETGVDQVYLHQFDNSATAGWDCCRSAEDRQAYGDDWGSCGTAQAHLANVYYEELQKRVPNIKFNLVQSFYGEHTLQPTFAEYYKAMDPLLYPPITTLIRETGRKHLEDFRSRFPNRAFYAYIEDDESFQWWPVFQTMARYSKDYYFPNHPDQERDVVYFHPTGGLHSLSRAMFSYFNWNVNAPGAESCADCKFVLHPRRDIESMSSDMQKALQVITDYEYGEKWGRLVRQAVMTWASPGICSGTAYNNWAWSYMKTWFPELQKYPAAEERMRLLELMVDEVECILPKAEASFSETDYAEDVFPLYPIIMSMAVMAEPIYWEERCNRLKVPEDYVQGLQAVKKSQARWTAVDARMSSSPDQFWLAKQHWHGSSLKNSMTQYENFFKSKITIEAAYFSCVDAVVVAPGSQLKFKIEYGSLSGGAPALKYVQKPNWVNAVGPDLSGTVPSQFGIDTVVAVLEMNGLAVDTLLMRIVIADKGKVEEEGPVSLTGKRNAPAPLFNLTFVAWGRQSGLVAWVEHAGRVNLRVYDVHGKTIWSDQVFAPRAGRYEFRMAGMQAYLGCGIYMAVLKQGKRTIIKRFTSLLR